MDNQYVYTKDLAAAYIKSQYVINDPSFEMFFDSVKRFSGDVHDSVVLDIGCGGGQLLQRCLVENAKFGCGIDISKSMIDIAKTGCSSSTPLRFTVGDACFLPYPSKAFDKVLSRYVFQCIIDCGSVFREINRVLVDGGYFVGIFTTTEVVEGYEHLFDTELPVLVNGTVPVTNLVKSKPAIMGAIADVALEVVHDEYITPDSVISDIYEYKAQATLRHNLIVLRKTKCAIVA